MKNAAMEQLEERWQQEADRLHRRYVVEVVEACGLCPWAEGARLQGRTRATVLLHGEDAALDPAIAQLDQWAAEQRVDIGFLIFPRVKLGRVAFDEFVARLRSVEAQRRPPGEPAFVLAAFHPDADADVDDADRLVPFLRRSPDPCVQALRMSTLKRVRSGTPEGTQFVDISRLEEAAADDDAGQTVRERIALANRNTVQRMGVEGFAARVEDIHRDREQTYGLLERAR
jgi:hypothetical protein